MTPSSDAATPGRLNSLRGIRTRHQRRCPLLRARGHSHIPIEAVPTSHRRPMARGRRAEDPTHRLGRRHRRAPGRVPLPRRLRIPRPDRTRADRARCPRPVPVSDPSRQAYRLGAARAVQSRPVRLRIRPAGACARVCAGELQSGRAPPRAGALPRGAGSGVSRAAAGWLLRRAECCRVRGIRVRAYGPCGGKGIAEDGLGLHRPECRGVSAGAEGCGVDGWGG